MEILTSDKEEMTSSYGQFVPIEDILTETANRCGVEEDLGIELLEEVLIDKTEAELEKTKKILDAEKEDSLPAIAHGEAFFDEDDGTSVIINFDLDQDEEDVVGQGYEDEVKRDEEENSTPQLVEDLKEL